MTPLGLGFLTRPLAHRGLHDANAGTPENSLAACMDAMRAGYGIELDVQPASDGTPMVFHDETLDRMTDATGPVRDRDVQTLTALRLAGTQHTIPTLAEVLAAVAGRVPLLIEVKDQPGDPRAATADLIDATLDALAEYAGPVAIMSFNPFAVAHGAARKSDLPWGLTTGRTKALWPDDLDLEADILDAALDPRHYGGSFVSHGLNADRPLLLGKLASEGIPVLSWTVRSPEQEAQARAFAANITFEGYRPALPRPGA